MNKYKIGLLIGRFQPLHKGHIYLIKKTIEQVDKLIIGIGSANIINDDNPMDFQQRKNLMELMSKKENLQNRINRIIPLDDFYDDKKWLENVISQVEEFDVVIGNNEWTNKILEKANFPVLRFGFYKRYIYEGETIRKLINHPPAGGNTWQDRVPDYVVEPITKCMIPIKFKHLTLGGTFDHFHIGHKALINLAFKYGYKVSLGITKENLYQNKNLAILIENYEIRKNNVVNYLKKMKFIDRAIIVPITNIYGTTLINKSIDAILVSKDTYKNAVHINNKRQARKMLPLKIIVAPYVLDDGGEVVTSERIRIGEINSEGVNYSKIFTNKKQLFLPESMREEMRKPMGKVINIIPSDVCHPERSEGSHYNQVAELVIKEINKIKPIMVLSVGDVITNSLVNNGFVPNVKIIDFRSRRKYLDSGVVTPLLSRIINQPGTINSQAVEAIKKAINFNLQNHQSQILVINGEEDLLALPAILLAPLNSIVLYGQWNLGVVFVFISEDIKAKTKLLVNKFR